METLNLSVFSREGYERIQTDISKVPVIGKTEIDVRHSHITGRRRDDGRDGKSH